MGVLQKYRGLSYVGSFLPVPPEFLERVLRWSVTNTCETYRLIARQFDLSGNPKNWARAIELFETVLRLSTTPKYEDYAEAITLSYKLGDHGRCVLLFEKLLTHNFDWDRLFSHFVKDGFLEREGLPFFSAISSNFCTGNYSRSAEICDYFLGMCQRLEPYKNSQIGQLPAYIYGAAAHFKANHDLKAAEFYNLVLHTYPTKDYFLVNKEPSVWVFSHTNPYYSIGLKGTWGDLMSGPPLSEAPLTYSTQFFEFAVEANLKSKNYEMASRHFEELFKINPYPSYDRLIAATKSNFRAGNLPRACRLLEAAFALNSHAPAEHYRDAVTIFEEALKRNPTLQNYRNAAKANFLSTHFSRAAHLRVELEKKFPTEGLLDQRPSTKVEGLEIGLKGTVKLI